MVTIHDRTEVLMAQKLSEALAKRMSIKHDIPKEVTDSIAADIYSTGAMKIIIDITNKRLDEYFGKE